MSEVELLGRYWVGVECCFCGMMSDEEYSLIRKGEEFEVC
jgi:hypothetical protein